MKIHLQNLAQIIEPKSLFRGLFLGAGVIFLLCTVINLAAIPHGTIAPKAIIYSKDNDAGRGIQTTMLSEWYKSNHFAPYGNFYYRIANTISKFSPTRIAPQYEGYEREEIIAQFAAITTSVLCLVAFSLWLGFLLTHRWDYSLYLATIFFHLFILDPTWVEFLFRVHPEHLLILMSGCASYFTLKYSKDEDAKSFIIAGLFWGLAMAVKRSIVLFVPSFIFLFLSFGLNKKGLLSGVKFIGWMLLSYLIIGFPQNFSFYKHLSFLIGETHNSVPATQDSVIEYLGLLWDQSKFLILAFIPVHLLFGVRSKLMNWRILIFTLIAIIFVISRKMMTPHNHHVMAHVALILIVAMYAIKTLPTISSRYRTPSFLIFSLCALWFLRDQYQTVDKVYAEEMDCQPEHLTALATIKNLQLDNSKILGRDPYFPFNSNKENHKQFWGITLQDIDSGKFDILGISRNFGSRFLGDVWAHLPQEKKDKWPAQQEAYKNLLTTDSFTTPAGLKYKKLQEDRCGLIIWEKAQ